MSSFFWDMTQCRPLKVDRYFGGIRRLSLKMEVSYSCETVVHFQLTTLRYIPEDRTHLQNNLMTQSILEGLIISSSINCLLYRILMFIAVFTKMMSLDPTFSHFSTGSHFMPRFSEIHNNIIFLVLSRPAKYHSGTPINWLQIIRISP
jgi:hypothetical protein